MIDTYSVNSLKLMDKSLEALKNKYIEGLELIKKDENALLGNIFHGLILYYLKNFNIEKFEQTLSDIEKEAFNSLKNSEIMKFILSSEEKFIEQPFFVKVNENKPFYLTGRFDLIVKNSEKYTIIDWKTHTLPKNPECDIQTMVYTYSLSQMKKTENIEIIYYSIFDKISAMAVFQADYIDKIKSIINKVF